MTEPRKKAKKEVWIWVGVVVCICVMLYAGLQIYTQAKEDNQGEDAYLALRNTVITGEEENFDEVLSETRISIPALKTFSGDAVAWIYSEGTVIDYPVVQGEDNQFYLNHLYDGTQNKVGSIFLDYRNVPDFSDQNSILYGHHMKSGKMFASIEEYKEQGYYDAHPFLMLETQEGAYRIELIAGYLADGAQNDLKLNFEQEEEFLSFLEQSKDKSTFRSNTEVLGSDKIITMVTCASDFQDARYVLVGKVVKI